MDIKSIALLLGGLAFFLFGMHIMSGSLSKMTGGGLERSLQKVTSNRFLSLVLGAVITIALQSSSATTVMLVGLASSGIMTFAQTINVIFGANIGTTLTSWILSLSSVKGDSLFISLIKPEVFSPFIAIIGIALIMMAKKDKNKSIGTVLVGFAVLMYGMVMMKDAVEPLSSIPEFNQMLISFNNPVLGLLVGVLFTAIIQSSAASIGILQALSMTGAIPVSMAIPIVIGQNIGTCVTAVISSIGASKEGKRVAVLHLLIKVVGMLIILPLFLILNGIFKFSFASISADPVSIAIIHSVFNILNTVILMPFSKLLIKITEKIVRDKNEKKDERRDISYLDERLLKSPSVAITECNSISKKMAKLARDTVFMSIDVIEKYDKNKGEQIIKNEDDIDLYEDRLGTYLVKMSPLALSEKDSNVIAKMLHTIGDFERLGDHALNLLKVAEEISTKKLEFSAEAQKELKVLTEAVSEIVTITTAAYEDNNIELASRVEPLEQVIDKLTDEIKDNHINRLQHGTCTIEMGFVLSDLLTNYERISDHCSNIAVAIIEAEHNSFDSHQYLNSIKYGDKEFDAMYSEYDSKYALV